ncbi:hypothetical protein [Kitasatospora sp. GP82]|uniref:hypothetical protein n=1 Tax=Kitasatospora sp. GP82 TaxID=3035089 RepID=UPI00247D25A9|nr:hypothetical protein [Kitasatospora sp. GP82]
MATTHDVLPAPAPPLAPVAETGAPIVTRRRPGRLVTSALALLLLALALNSVVRNQAFQWDVVGQYFTTTAIVNGLVLTLRPPTPLQRARAALTSPAGDRS